MCLKSRWPIIFPLLSLSSPVDSNSTGSISSSSKASCRPLPRFLTLFITNPGADDPSDCVDFASIDECESPINAKDFVGVLDYYLLFNNSDVFASSTSQSSQSSEDTAASSASIREKDEFDYLATANACLEEASTVDSTRSYSDSASAITSFGEVPGAINAGLAPLRFILLVLRWA